MSQTTICDKLHSIGSRYHAYCVWCKCWMCMCWFVFVCLLVMIEGEHLMVEFIYFYVWYRFKETRNIIHRERPRPPYDIICEGVCVCNRVIFPEEFLIFTNFRRVYLLENHDCLEKNREKKCREKEFLVAWNRFLRFQNLAQRKVEEIKRKSNFLFYISVCGVCLCVAERDGAVYKS